MKHKKSSKIHFFHKILSLLVITVSFFGLSTMSLAEESNTTSPTSPDSTSSYVPDVNLKMKSFNLNTLKAPNQKTTYLDVAKNGTPIAAFIIQIINFLTLSIGSLSLLLLIAGGVVLISSAGNENQLTKGKDIIKWAIIGLVLTLSSYYIVAFVQSLFFEK